MLRPRKQGTPTTVPRVDFRRGIFATLKTRLRWSYALVSVIPMALLGISLITFSLRGQRANIAQKQQTTANWVAREIRTSLSSVNEQMLRFGQQVGPTKSDAEVLGQIYALRGSMPEIIDIAIMDSSGREQRHVSQLRGFFESELIDRSSDELVQWTLQTGRVAQGPITRQADGILIYPAYAPILSDVGEVVGAIRAEVRIDRIARSLREAPLDRGSLAYLVDNTGKLLLADDQGSLRSAPPTLATLLDGKQSSAEYSNSAGTTVVGAWDMVPVQPSRWWVVVEIPRSLAYAPVQRDSLILLGSVAVVIVTTIGWGLYQSKHILQPIEELRAGAVLLGTGDLSARMPIHANDEIGELAVEFNRMAERLQISRDQIEHQNERLRQGLAMARDIQIGLLPSTPPGDIPHLAVRAHSVPAYEVGGDFYTYVAIDDRRMAVSIGDISGKGVGAALMMALASSMVEAQGRTTVQPHQLLAVLNQQLSARLTANHMNAALLYAIIDIEAATISVANAGMIPPFLLRDGKVQMIEAYGFPLGSMIDARYAPVKVDLQPGDLLVLVSDGIVEAHRAGRELFGFDRLEQTLSEYDAALGPDELIAMLVDRVTQFMDGAEQHDDMTIVVIQPNLSVAVTEQDALPMHELAV